MPSGFEVNQQGIREIQRRLQREFDKHPVRIPVEADPEMPVVHQTTINGPTVISNGDRAQIAWGESVSQTQDGTTTQVAQGYEDVAALLADVVRDLATAGLPEEDETVVRKAAEEGLREVGKPEPDRTAVKMCLSAVTGVLAPIAMRAVDGVGDAAQKWAAEAVAALMQAL